MTAEIALLNRSAVALAADSAVTISYWRNGQEHTRYSKTANKIFHISSTRPVGVMIYQSGTLQGMPWEVISKAYRTARGDQRFAKLDDYVTDVFDYIGADPNIFPRAKQNIQLRKNIELAATHICGDIELAQADVVMTDDARIADVARRLDELAEDLAQMDSIDSIDFQSVSDEVDNGKQDIIDGFEGYAAFDALKPFVDINRLYQLALSLAFKKESPVLSDTGVVFAGFGEDEYFPRMLGFRCYGVLFGKLIYDVVPEQNLAISHENVSEIEPVAQSNMVNTFIHGVSMAALVKMEELFLEGLGECLGGLSTDGTSKLAPEEIKQHQTEAANRFSKEMTDYLWREHTQPLRQVIGTLSIAELAELAETLISIESLKERVTRPTESVSGPIDVAVISKTDGFIWIKRKHYFDKDMNPRYFNNTRA